MAIFCCPLHLHKGRSPRRSAPRDDGEVYAPRDDGEVYAPRDDVGLSRHCEGVSP